MRDQAKLPITPHWHIPHAGYHRWFDALSAIIVERIEIAA